METSDLLMVLMLEKVVWRFAAIKLGVQFVMTFGILLMQVWLAYNLDIKAQVRVVNTILIIIMQLLDSHFSYM